MIAFPDHYGSFLAHLGEKLQAGQKEYGSASFYRPERDLLTELQAEALDLAGWGYVLYAKIEALKAKTPDPDCKCRVRPKVFRYEWDDKSPTGKTVVECDKSEACREGEVVAADKRPD